MLCERHAWLSLFLTGDYAESTRKDDEILENNGKKNLKKILCSFCYRAKVPLGKVAWTFRWRGDWDSNEQRKNCSRFWLLRRRRNRSWQLWKLKQLRRNPSGNCVILFFSGQQPCVPFESTHYNIGFSRPRISLIWTSGFRILKLPLCGYLRTSFSSRVSLN